MKIRMKKEEASKIGSRTRSRRLFLVPFIVLGFFVILSDISYSSFRLVHIQTSIDTDGASLRNNPSIGNVFIAVNLYQSEALLRDGSWARAILELIDLIGSANVYLSIFENNSTDETPRLLKDLKKRVKCKYQIVTTTLNLADHQYAPLYTRNTTDTYLSRIAYLAMIRNRALEPLLYNGIDISNNSGRRFSKILFLNDVVFSSEDAFRLLRTNDGDYAAACALDFISPIKFYDTLATRDFNGYSMGLPLYPFFSPGESQSEIRRRHGLVHVKSCWSGMVAFDSIPFTNGLKFRSLHTESNWDASECCLIHADINQPIRTFINPSIRVAYSTAVYTWQKRLAHFETVWTLVQKSITYIAGLPRYNKYRTSGNGGFCWVQGKMLIKNRNSHYHHGIA